MNFIFSLRVGAVLDHFGYPAPSITQWQQHLWYDLGAIHNCVYEMRNRLAMGRSPQPRSASPVAVAAASASSAQSHPRVGQKALRIPPESAPAASTTGRSAETPPESSSTKNKDKRKKRKRKEEGDASPSKPKKPKRRAVSVASSDTEIYDPTVKEERPLLWLCLLSLQIPRQRGLSLTVVTLRGQKVPQSQKGSLQVIINKILFSCKYVQKFYLYLLQAVFCAY